MAGYNNKVVYFGQTLMDLTGDTAETGDVREGKTFHLKSGAPAVGSWVGVTSEPLSVTNNGTYTAPAGSAYNPVTVAVPTVNRGMLIEVAAPTGSVVTAVKDGVTYNGVEDALNPGSFTVEVPDYGTYTVTATLNGNVASKTVVIDRESATLNPVLPAGYTRLAYIEATGTQYINTGYQPITQQAGMELTFSAMAYGAGSKVMAAASDQSNGTNWNNQFGLAFDNTVWFYVGASSGGINTGTTPVSGTFAIRDSALYYNDAKMSDFPQNTFSYAFPIFIFAGNLAGTAAYLSSFRLHSFKISDDGAVVRSFLPARRESDQAIGLFDTVSRQFFANAGTGSFIAGPDA